MHAIHLQGLSKYISDLVMQMHMYSNTLGAFYDSWRKRVFIIRSLWVYSTMHIHLDYKSENAKCGHAPSS